ncbi:hypothetical protein ZBT109_0422 [Zymobacter palmae]|uniref:Uncharacterized protein n=1 Tax=Zymobacter palmae TaxID=33074 RepID=A0A348HC59_9GAMM|nr:hypothetical protein ZBT109_0422 [Zymobacter palmae]
MPSRLDLNESKFTFYVIAFGQIHQLDHFDQPVEMLDDLFNATTITGRRHGQP